MPPLNRTTYGLDLAGQRVSVKNPLGKVWTSLYDCRGLTRASVDPLGNRVTNSFDAAAQHVAIKNPLGNVTTSLWDAAGRAKATVDPLGNRTTYVHDAASRQVASVDPLGRRTTSLYDAAGRTRASLDALGNRTTLGYDAASRNVTLQDALGRVTTTVFDAADRRKATVNALSERTTVTYDAASQAVAVTNALGKVATTVFDAAARTKAVVNERGSRTTFGYDGASQRVSVKSPLGKVWTTLFDSRGLSRASIDPLGNRSTMVHDAAGQGVAVVDPLSRRTTTVYDALGRGVATVNALGHRVTQVFDGADNRVALVDGRANRYTFQYDAGSREVVQVDPLSRRTTAAYDAASQRVLRIDARGNRTTYVWDNGGRMIGRRYPDGSRVTMAFDAVGSRTKLHDSTGRYTTVWDSLNRELSVTNAAAKTITYSYDAASRRRLMFEPEGGRLTYGYFDDGLARFVENPQNQRTTWSYDNAGQSLVQRLANGARASYAYDDGGRMLRLANLKSDGTTISSFRDTWDAAGNRTSRLHGDGVRVTWSYNATYQLTRERRGGANSYDITYTYDASSNRRLKLEDGVRTTYTCDTVNQLLTVKEGSGTSTYTWDANGNQRTEQVLGGGITTNTWDYENRLTRVLLPSGARSTFAYRADGLRVEKRDSTGTFKAIWDGKKIQAETDGTDVIQVVYCSSPGVHGDLISQRRSGVTAYFHFDPLGSTWNLSDSSGAATDVYVYTAFGNAVLSSGSTINRFRFIGRAGYYFDGDLAQYFIRRRSLRPDHGRFLSRDPLVHQANRTNPYTYVEGKPTARIDPSGLLCINAEPVDFRGCDPVWLYQWRATINLEGETDGFVIQKVTRNYKIVDCIGGDRREVSQQCGVYTKVVSYDECDIEWAITEPQPLVYWELWWVSGGEVFLGTPHNGMSAALTEVSDTWEASSPLRPPTCGKLDQRGEVFFVKSDEGIPPGGWNVWNVRRDQEPGAIDLAVTCELPPELLKELENAKEVGRWIDLDWCCCETPYREWYAKSVFGACEK